jgi:hypothetical protein
MRGASEAIQHGNILLDNNVAAILHFSPVKKVLQKVGSFKQLVMGVIYRRCAGCGAINIWLLT